MTTYDNKGIKGAQLKSIAQQLATKIKTKQGTVSTDTDSSAFSDATEIATGFGSDKIHFNVASRLWNYIKGKLGISSSGSSTKFLNEQGEWATVTSPDVSGKADKVSGATAGDVATLDANGNLVDSGKTLGTSVPADAAFTDDKVAQMKADSSTTAYPLLMAGTTDPRGNATVTRYDSSVTLDPSTNTIAANISGNAATANALATPRKIDGVEFDGSGDVIHYGECNTAAAVQAKVIVCPGFVLTTGARIIIKFTQNNNFREPTFNVNNTGAVPVRYFGSLLPYANFLRTGAVYQFIYDGTNYCFVGNFDNNNYAYQTALSNNAEYPVLCKNNANQTAENNYVRYASGITMNPSTNKITASGGFVGNLSGNAATADSASTASSADIAVSTSSGTILGNSDLNSYNVANRNYLCNATNAATVSNKPSGASGAFELEVIRGTGDTCVQVYYSRDDVNFNYIRKRTGNDAWTGWVKMYRDEWVSFTPDTLQTTEAAKIFAIGNIEVGYYFDSGSNFRLSMRSTSGTRYVYLADQHGNGGGYALTTGWTGIMIYGFTNSNQLESLKGYDTTGNVNLEFDVYYANGASQFVPVAQYRVNS